ncbi:MAG: helix-turn-helix transcriptional regulator [Neoaquamicrobium sediminum]
MERTLLGVDEVLRRTSLSRSQLYILIGKKSFPKNFALAGTRRKVFDSIAVQNWIDEQARVAATER